MTMAKKLIGIAIFVFWAVSVSIITAGLVFYQNNLNINGQIPGSSSGQLANNSQNATSVVLSLDEIAKHNSAGNCWLVINSKVYDVTNFINSHPGGTQTIAPYCGKPDATQAFDTKDLKPPTTHSQQADSLLAAYYIGDLNQKISQPAGSGANGTQGSHPNPAVNITDREHENERED